MNLTQYSNEVMKFIREEIVSEEESEISKQIFLDDIVLGNATVQRTKI
jgi:hypothetical protein